MRYVCRDFDDIMKLYVYPAIDISQGRSMILDGDTMEWKAIKMTTGKYSGYQSSPVAACWPMSR